MQPSEKRKHMEPRPECRRYLVSTRTSTSLNACPLMRIVKKYARVHEYTNPTPVPLVSALSSCGLVTRHFAGGGGSGSSAARREADLFSVVINHTAVSGSRGQHRAFSWQLAGREKTYSSRRRKNQTSKSSFLRTLLAHSLCCSASRSASFWAAGPLPVKNRTVSSHSSPCKLRGI